MATVSTGQPVTAKTRFKDSSWLTISWNWVTTLIGVAAEPVLTVAMVFSCYELIPNAPQPSAAINNTFFVCQFVALDFGGLALGKMAKQSGLGWRSFPRIVSMILIAITLVTMTYSGIQHVWPDINPNVTKGVEATLVIMRAIMTVLYSKAIHDLAPHEEGQGAGVQPGAILQVQPQGGASPQVQEVQALRAEVQALRAEVQVLVQQANRVEVQGQEGAMSEGHLSLVGVQDQISEMQDDLLEVQDQVQGQLAEVQPGASMQMLPTVVGVQEGATSGVQGASELNAPRQSRCKVQPGGATSGVQQASCETRVQGARVQGVQVKGATSGVQGAASESQVQQPASVEVQGATDEGQLVQHNTEPLHLPVDLQVQGSATPSGYRDAIFAYVLQEVQRTGKEPSVNEIRVGVGCGERTVKSYRAAAIAKAREAVAYAQ